MDDKQLCMRLINAVKERPSLYNFNLTESYDRCLAEEKWKEVAELVGLNVYKCREKWRNLNAVLKRYLRRGTCSRRYYLYEQLKFVIPFLRLNKPLQARKIQIPNQSKHIQKVIQNSDTTLHESLNYNTATVMKCPSPVSTHEVSSHSLNDHSYNNDASAHNQIERTEYSESLNSDMIKQDEDAKKAFLMSLLPDIYTMNPQQMRNFKKCVSDIVEQILDGGNETLVVTNNSYD